MLAYERGRTSMAPPDEELIRGDNPHFGPVIRLVSPIERYEGGRFGHTHTVTVGARGSRFPGEDEIFDAWATYLWHPERRRWELGAN